MLNTAKLATLALVATIATSAFVSDASAKGVGPHPNPPPVVNHGSPDITCKVKDFDFWIINFGDTNLDSGRQVEWRSPTTEDAGIIMLPKMLAPGEQIKLADVLSDEAYRGAPCTAAFV